MGFWPLAWQNLGMGASDAGEVDTGGDGEIFYASDGGRLFTLAQTPRAVALVDGGRSFVASDSGRGFTMPDAGRSLIAEDG